MNRIAISLLAGLAMSLGACSQRGTPATTSVPPDTGALLRSVLGDVGDAAYFDANVDLDDDGKEEIVAYVAGPMVCGTGGCPLLVFTPGRDGYDPVANISIVQTPVRVSSRSSGGWRNLIVHVAGGGVEAHDAELAFDGKTYPANPSVPPAAAAADLDGAEILIPDFESLRDGKPLSRQ